MKMSFSRRSLLQALTVGAGSLTFGANRFGRRRGARASGPGVPRRLIIYPIMNGGGIDPDGSHYATLGGSPTDFALGPILQPFDDLGLKDQLVIMRGFTLTWQGDVHNTGTVQMLTGSAPVKVDGQYMPNATGPSIDQVLASKIGAGMPWPSLTMGTHTSYTCSFRADLTPVYGNQDPLDLYQRVFGNLTAGGPDAGLLRRLARRQSVLDAVAKDVNAFVKRLPTEDRARAESQLAAIQSLEAQLTTQAQGSMSACQKPMLASPPDELPDTVRKFSDLAVAAMACDQTRVVLMHTFLGGDGCCGGNGYPPVNAPDSTHHGLSHGDASMGFDTVKDKYADGVAWLACRRFHHQLMAELADKLNRIPEPSGGGTMLDHTIILIPTESGVINGHNPGDVLWTSIGGKGLGVKTGQYLKLADTATAWDMIPSGPAVQRLHVALLNALGLPDQTFNEDAGSGSGPLPGYLA